MGMPDLLDQARGLGLRVHGLSASGLFDGRPVELAHSLAHDSQVVAVVRARLEPPLDLGLALRRRAIAGFVAPPSRTGSADLDAEFSLDVDDADRCRAFFTPDLRAGLLALHRRGVDLALSDGSVDVFAEAIDSDEPGALGRLLGAVVATAALVDEARRTLPPAQSLAPFAGALAPFAKARGLSLAVAPIGLEGAIDGHPVSVRSRRTYLGRHRLTARVGLGGDLGLGLGIRRQTFVDDVAILVGGQDLIVGSDAFDRRFRVRASPEAAHRVPALVDADVAALVLAADAELGPIAIDDLGFVVDPVDLHADPGALPKHLAALVEAAARLTRNFGAAGASGLAYR